MHFELFYSRLFDNGIGYTLFMNLSDLTATRDGVVIIREPVAQKASLRSPPEDLKRFLVELDSHVYNIQNSYFTD